MEQFRAVKIIHSISNRLEFLFLAEFFHFCGLYVGEETLGSTDFDPVRDVEDRCFDVFICVSDGGDFRTNLRYEECDSRFQKVRGRFIFFNGIKREVLKNRNSKKKNIHELTYWQQNKILQVSVKKIIKALHLSIQDNSWKNLIEIYVNNRLMLHSSSLQYYAQRNSSAVKEAGEGMLAAYRQFEGQKELLDSEIGDYANYAKIWCAVKVNEADKYQGIALQFEPQKLAEDCERLAAANPDFSNAYVLKGLCYENSTDKAIEAITAFQQALGMEKTKCYAASIYYWIGKRFEAYEARQEEAEKSYQLAYNSRKKFRNIYKVAMFANEAGRYEKAIECYQEIIDALKEKRGMRMQDPLELEYEFKAHHHLCVIFYNHCDDVTVKYRKIISYAQRAIEIAEEGINDSIMYKKLYGGSAEVYRKISRERMSLKEIYRILFATYSELREEELARIYRDKM